MNKKYVKSPASFRDPSGFIFFNKNKPFRAINNRYREHYDQLIKSGLFKKLVDEELLIPHKEKNIENLKYKNFFKILEPQCLEFVSYPYEWSFSQLKDAALATLRIQKLSMQKGMTLKDASAYNIQFHNGKPMLIDILSFEKYRDGEPWIAYRQFCQHFLAPLALMSYKDVRLNSLLKNSIYGIPLDLASKLLPLKTKINFHLMTNIHLHSKFQSKYSNRSEKITGKKVSSRNLLAIIESLESGIRSLKWHPKGTEWANYYEETNYSKNGIKDKERIIEEYLSKVSPKIVWDLGANNGEFGRIALKNDINLVASFDMEPAAVEQNYRFVKKNKETKHLPLLLDLTNPSPAIGWRNKERMSLLQRANADTVLALALIHHLAISNNLSFDMQAKFFSEICKSLIIEFIPKEDSNAERLLAVREDIFEDYNESYFVKAFGEYFVIKDKNKIKGSTRTIYLMVKK